MTQTTDQQQRGHEADLKLIQPLDGLLVTTQPDGDGFFSFDELFTAAPTTDQVAAHEAEAQRRFEEIRRRRTGLVAG